MALSLLFFVFLLYQVVVANEIVGKSPSVPGDASLGVAGSILEELIGNMGEE